MCSLWRCCRVSSLIQQETPGSGTNDRLCTVHSSVIPEGSGSAAFACVKRARKRRFSAPCWFGCAGQPGGDRADEEGAGSTVLAVPEQQKERARPTVLDSEVSFV